MRLFWTILSVALSWTVLITLWVGAVKLGDTLKERNQQKRCPVCQRTGSVLLEEGLTWVHEWCDRHHARYYRIRKLQDELFPCTGPTPQEQLMAKLEAWTPPSAEPTTSSEPKPKRPSSPQGTNSYASSSTSIPSGNVPAGYRPMPRTYTSNVPQPPSWGYSSVTVYKRQVSPPPKPKK